jgi:hypothetical protein
MVNLEIFICYNENGDVEADTEAEIAAEHFAENIGGECRIIKLSIQAPNPISTVKVVIPEKDEPITVTAE